MIAVVDETGRRVYNSPAYQRILGYSTAELRTLHAGPNSPRRRQRVLEASHKARSTGQGQRLEYRIRHKDGSWRILESTASVFAIKKGRRQVVMSIVTLLNAIARKMLLAHNALHGWPHQSAGTVLFFPRSPAARIALSKRYPNYKFAVLS